MMSAMIVALILALYIVAVCTTLFLLPLALYLQCIEWDKKHKNKVVDKSGHLITKVAQNFWLGK